MCTLEARLGCPVATLKGIWGDPLYTQKHPTNMRKKKKKTCAAAQLGVPSVTRPTNGHALKAKPKRGPRKLGPGFPLLSPVCAWVSTHWGRPSRRKRSPGMGWTALASQNSSQKRVFDLGTDTIYEVVAPFASASDESGRGKDGSFPRGFPEGDFQGS